MKTLKIMLILVVLASLMMVACGGKPKAPTGPREVYRPAWYDQQGNAEYVFTYGQADGATQRTAEASATAAAAAEAAYYVEIYVQAMTKDFIGEAGVDNPEVVRLTDQVTKTVANTKFSGMHITNRQVVTLDNGRFQAFIQYAVPKEQINRDLMNRVRNEEALYNRFRASQAFDDLERAVQNY